MSDKRPVESKPSDKERFLALMADFGITPEVKGDTLVLAQDDSNEKVDGYFHFFCEWEFDAEGNFVKVSIWE